jgi:hypothetical protein
MPFIRRVIGSRAASSLGAVSTIAVLAVLLRGEEAASAAPPWFSDIVTESCAHTFTSGLETVAYAEHAYPGVPRRALAGVKAVGHLASQQGAPPGYEFLVAESSVFIKDGAVAVRCGNKAAAAYDSVTFLFP